MHKIIEECCEEVPEEQKQNMEKMMLDLVKICHHKQFLCIHDNVNNLIESALDSKLLSINSINSQRLDKKEQEIKNVEEQPAERRNHAERSLQNFRVIHKSSISLNTSQISSVHANTPILSTREPENSLSMGYEHLSINPEMESDEVMESNAENLLPIPNECEVALEDKRECDLLISKNSPVCDNSDTFSDSEINDDISVYDDDFKNIEYVEASLSDPEIVNVEEENVVHQEEEEVVLEDISQVQDEQEVKNVEEQPAERRNHAEKSLQNLRVIHKNSIISSVHADTPILSTKEPDNSLSMGYEHLSITPETESDEVTEYNAKNLLPIPSECEVTSEDKRGCDELVCENPSTIDVCDNHSKILFDSNNDDLSSDDESYEDNDINCLIANIESLKDNPTPVCVFNSSTSTPIFEESDNSLSLPEFETFYDHTEETRSDNTTTHATDSLPEYDSFRFEIELDQEELFNFVMKDISDDPSIPRPPPKLPDDDFDLEPEAISALMENIDLGGEIFISTKNEDVDHFPFIK
nr:hypothetical protein [Tanacetum cinerariifolium]